MSTMDNAPRTVRAEGRRFTHRSTVFAVLACAAVSFGAWAWAERPVPLPDYRGAISGLAFSPFHRGESPETKVFPTEAEITSDIARAAEVTDRIRTYTVAGVLGDIPRLAESSGLKVTAGAWLDRNAATNAAELDRLIQVANDNLDVDHVLVGNETLLREDLTATQLIAAIRHVKAGVHVPVSTAEPWHVWLAHPELAKAVDVITIHLLPYWEKLPVEDALRFTLEKLDAVQAAYPGKKVVVGEVGWPSNGVDIGAAHASRVNQALFLRQFFAAAANRHVDYFVMEAFDQPWKTAFEGRAAGYWGIMDLDRVAKWGTIGAVGETPGWAGWAAAATLGSALLAWLLLSRRPDLRMAGKLLMAALAQAFGTVFACVLLAMSGKYLSGFASVVWGTLAAAQALLLALLLADSFELVETVFGRTWKRRLVPTAAPTGARLPKVSVHIPICNEPPHMVRQTLDALSRLDYPDFEVLVIDNNTMDPALWEPVAEHCARLGSRFRFFHLGKYPGFKAGALNFGLRQTAPDAEIIGVLDSDYVVEPNWLRCMAPRFADPRVGFVQSPQDYRDAGESLFKRLMFWEYAGFFHLGMVTRNERNAIIQHGTMTLVRATALRDGDGWAEWCITEDAELGVRLFRAGWEAEYSPRGFGRGVMPDDFAAFRKQRHRWAYGAMRIMRAHLGALLSPFDRSLTLGQRWHFVTGWLPWVGDALGLAFTLMGLVWSIGLIAQPMRFEFPIVLFMLPSIALFGFKIVQIFALYGSRVPCGWADRAAAALAGLALSHTIGKAVWSGLFTSRAPFLRTPKMKDAPALVQGLVMARQELALLALTWGAAVGVALAHRLGTWEARLWCVVLLTQSLPYLASVAVSLIAAMPARRAALPAPAWTPVDQLATGD